MTVPPALVRVPSQRPLALNVASVMSVANDKGHNEITLGLCTDLLAFTLQLRKTSARGLFGEGAVRPVIASNGVPFLKMRSVGSHITSGRKRKELRKGRGGRVRFIELNLYRSVVN